MTCATTAAGRTQLDRLDAVIATAQRARIAASRGDLFASNPGHALVNAMHDLTEVGGLYDLADDIAHEIGPDEALIIPGRMRTTAAFMEGRA